MAIIWAGGEDLDTDGNATNIISTWTDAGLFRAGYARCAIANNRGASAGAPAVGMVWTPNLTAGWASCRVAGTPQANKYIFGFGSGYAPTPSSWLMVGTSPSDATKISLYSWGGSGVSTLATQSGNSYGSGSQIYKIDIQLIDSTHVNVYWDGVQIIGYTGSLLSSSFNCVVIGNPTSPGLHAGISEFIVANEDTRGLGVVTLAPNGGPGGDVAATWNGSYTDVNETTTNDNTYIYTSFASQPHDLALNDLPPGVTTVKAVKGIVRAATTGNPPPSAIQLGYIISSSRYYIGAVQSLSGGGYFTSKETPCWNSAPQAGGGAWTIADINALRIYLYSS